MLLRKPVLFFGISVVGWCIAQSALAATFTVNSPEATDDGTCTHPYVDAANDCTLEEAIDDANAAGGSDTVNFNISTANFADDGDGQFTISLGNTVLPTINTAVELDAVSMWDTTGTKQ
ncbi:MAG TPA: hypothetical protein DEG44_02160, partial [Candidatus Kerfeldbacteria bacterium]|nr:hypothetical protein [Candidatus Kerfeldbacteria bacterium]